MSSSFPFFRSGSSFFKSNVFRFVSPSSKFTIFVEKTPSNTGPWWTFQKGFQKGILREPWCVACLCVVPPLIFTVNNYKKLNIVSGCQTGSCGKVVIDNDNVASESHSIAIGSESESMHESSMMHDVVNSMMHDIVNSSDESKGSFRETVEQNDFQNRVSTLLRDDIYDCYGVWMADVNDKESIQLGLACLKEESQNGETAKTHEARLQKHAFLNRHCDASVLFDRTSPPQQGIKDTKSSTTHSDRGGPQLECEGAQQYAKEDKERLEDDTLLESTLSRIRVVETKQHASKSLLELLDEDKLSIDEFCKRSSFSQPLVSLNVKTAETVTQSLNGNGKNVKTEDTESGKFDTFKKFRNPGLAVHLNFVSPEEEEALELECRNMVEQFGSFLGDEKITVRVADLNSQDTNSSGGPDGDSTAVYENSRKTAPGNNYNNNSTSFEHRYRRCTGREEKIENHNETVAKKKHAPWGYGSDFKEHILGELAPNVKTIADRIREAHPRLGKLRDVTINLRGDSFFYTHPHIDPLGDGPHNFVLGLLSATVLTLSPGDEMIRNHNLNQRNYFNFHNDESKSVSWEINDESKSVSHADFGSHAGKRPTNLEVLEVRQGQAAAEKSWTDADLDILFRKRSLIGFSREARYFWKHGIRSGMAVPVNEHNETTTVDFFGDYRTLCPRQKERISIVFAFADRRSD